MLQKPFPAQSIGPITPPTVLLETILLKTMPPILVRCLQVIITITIRYHTKILVIDLLLQVPPNTMAIMNPFLTFLIILRNSILIMAQKLPVILSVA